MTFQSQLRWNLILFTAVCTVVCFIGAYFNSKNTKHIRISAALGRCQHNTLIVTSIKDSFSCCDPSHQASYASIELCDVAFHKANAILSSFYAWILPLLPWFATFVVEIWQLKSFTNSFNNNSQRLFLHISICYLRTFVLYILGKRIESFLQPPEASECWYQALTRKKVCRDNFDYSDHVVLYMVQYGLPCIIEITHAMVHPTLKCELVFTFVIAGILLVISIKGILSTALHFHSRAETIVALFLSLATLYLLQEYLAPILKRRGYIFHKVYDSAVFMMSLIYICYIATHKS